jgi:hypothetical protein
MQGYYIKALAAAQRNDPGAIISNDSGIAAIVANGKTIELTNVMQHDYATGAQTVERQIDRALGIVAPAAPAAPPLPAASDAWTVGAVITEGNKTFEVRNTPFGPMPFLVKAAPAAAPAATVVSERAAFVAFIKAQLSTSDSAEVQTALVAQLTWISRRV